MMKPPPSSLNIMVTELSEPPKGMFAEHVEDDWFYRSVEGTMPGFSFGYLQLTNTNQTNCVAPYFLTRFSFGTMLPEGIWRRLIGWAGISIACVGHPIAAIGRIDGNFDEEAVSTIASSLLRKAPIVAFKGFDENLPARGFVRVDGLPACLVHLDSIDWAKIRSGRNIKRKIKAAASVRFEEHQGLPPQYFDRVFDLYSQTHERASIVFGKLSKKYFTNTSEGSIYLLAFLEGNDAQPIAFAQIHIKGEKATANFMGMDYQVSEGLGLYFALVIRIMDLVHERKLKIIDLGETSYTFKQKIGSTLQPTWIYYRHRNKVMNWLLHRMAWILEPSAEDLR